MRALWVIALALSLAACTPRPNTATDVSIKGQDVAVASPIASATEAPKEAREEKGPLYLLRDTGKRCFAAPCPSWAAVDVETRIEKEITGVDLGALGLDARKHEDARARVLAGQVWVRGQIKTVPKAGPAGDGTVLFVSAIVEQDAAPAP
jgi:hypothetical protein